MSFSRLRGREALAVHWLIVTYLLASLVILLLGLQQLGVLTLMWPNVSHCYLHSHFGYVQVSNVDVLCSLFCIFVNIYFFTYMSVVQCVLVAGRPADRRNTHLIL
jgi:hypothetical protein